MSAPKSSSDTTIYNLIEADPSFVARSKHQSIDAYSKSSHPTNLWRKSAKPFGGGLINSTEFRE